LPTAMVSHPKFRQLRCRAFFLPMAKARGIQRLCWVSDRPTRLQFTRSNPCLRLDRDLIQRSRAVLAYKAWPTTITGAMERLQLGS
jgi:hypothetical protein